MKGTKGQVFLDATTLSITSTSSKINIGTAANPHTVAVSVQSTLHVSLAVAFMLVRNTAAWPGSIQPGIGNWLAGAWLHDVCTALQCVVLWLLLSLATKHGAQLPDPHSVLFATCSAD